MEPVTPRRAGRVNEGAFDKAARKSPVSCADEEAGATKGRSLATAMSRIDQGQPSKQLPSLVGHGCRQPSVDKSRQFSLTAKPLGGDLSRTCRIGLSGAGRVVPQ